MRKNGDIFFLIITFGIYESLSIFSNISLINILSATPLIILAVFCDDPVKL